MGFLGLRFRVLYLEILVDIMGFLGLRFRVLYLEILVDIMVPNTG